MIDYREQSRFISVSDASLMLGVSESMIYKLIKAGELKAMRVGMAWRLCREALETWIQRKMSERTVPPADDVLEIPPALTPPARNGGGRKKRVR